MIRMSVLRNRPVVCREKQVGIVQNAVLDSARKRVQALIVSGGLKGKFVVPVHAVQAIADSFILTEGTQKYLRTMERNVSPFVRDTSGLLLGCITDYALDEETLSVLSVEMITGYLPWSGRKRVWITEYHCTGDSDLIIPASWNGGLILSEEGNRACVCPP